jgi:hypothetical protein
MFNRQQVVRRLHNPLCLKSQSRSKTTETAVLVLCNVHTVVGGEGERSLHW